MARFRLRQSSTQSTNRGGDSLRLPATPITVTIPAAGGRARASAPGFVLGPITVTIPAAGARARAVPVGILAGQVVAVPAASGRARSGPWPIPATAVIPAAGARARAVAPGVVSGIVLTVPAAGARAGTPAALPSFPLLVTIPGARAYGRAPRPTPRISLGSWSLDQSQKLNVDIQVSGRLTVPPKVAAPPGVPDPVTGIPVAAPDTMLVRVSETYASPTLDSKGFPPESWAPTSTLIVDWGRPQIVVAGVDVTFFRGVPVGLGPMTFNEPFSDATAQLIVPQLAPFEALGGGDLAWAVDGAAVDIWRVRADGTVDHTKPIFEGRLTTEEVADGEDHKPGGTSFTILGALYCADLFVKTPAFATPTADIRTLIGNELDARSVPGTLHLAPTVGAPTGILSSAKGSGSQLLNGYIQDLLGAASIAPAPPPGETVVGVTGRPDGGGYWVAATDGSVIPFGERTFYGGSMAGRPLNAVISGIAGMPSGLGYWLCAVDGGVFSFGDAGFHGEEASPAAEVSGIAATPTGLGYWLVDEGGHVYAFGDAGYHGGGAGASTIVAIAGTPTGLGYLLLDDTGHVYAYGDAVYSGGGSGTGHTFAGIAVRPGGGYWLVDTLGNVYGYGAATSLGSPPSPLNQPMSSICAHDNGGYWTAALDGGVFAYGDAAFHGSVPGADGEWEGWTLAKLPGRVPSVQLKDRWTVHATVWAGARGVNLDLVRDPTQVPSTVFGEGTDENNHRWRNSKYPNLRPAAPPLWPGVTLRLGTSDASCTTWTQAMHDAGWNVNVGPLFDGTNQAACRAFQLANGLQYTGEVGAQTWAATFLTGTNAGDTTGAYIAPLFQLPAVEPFLYDAFGAITGPNPKFSPTALRVERWENFGEHTSRYEAALSAISEVERYRGGGYVGTVTLNIDPVEMSRLDLRAGMNLLVKGYRGKDRLLHIGQCSIDWSQPKLSVSLTVDEYANDLVTLHAVRSRDRNTVDPVRRRRPSHRASRITPDRAAQWDFEAGGGIIPAFILQGGLWQVVRVPAAEAGTVVEVAITAASPATPFAAAIFKAPTTPAYLTNLVPNPLAGPGSPWDSFPATGNLVIAWGQNGQACGYTNPTSKAGSQQAGSPLTGFFDDNGTWDFTSLVPPWLWVGLWAQNTCTISGRIYPRPVDQ